MAQTSPLKKCIFWEIFADQYNLPDILKLDLNIFYGS